LAQFLQMSGCRVDNWANVVMPESAERLNMAVSLRCPSRLRAFELPNLKTSLCDKMSVVVSVAAPCGRTMPQRACPISLIRLPVRQRSRVLMKPWRQ